MRISSAGVMLSAMLLAGCSSDDGTASPSGPSGGSGGSGASGGTGGSGTGGGSGGTAASGGTGGGGTGGTGATGVGDCGGSPATTTASGVLTAYPNITANLVTPGFGLKTLNFTLTDDGDSRGPLLEMFAEVENTGTTTECTFLPQIMLELDEIISLLETPPYYGDIVDTVTSDCLAPGDIGVLPGVARGVTAAELSASGTLTIDVGPNTYGSYTPATDGPTLTATVTQVDTGWVLAGQILLRSTIHNYGMRVYPRDNRGVLVDELLAFPGTLGTLTVGSTVDFETEGSTCHFADYVLFDSWIVGP